MKGLDRRAFTCPDSGAGCDTSVPARHVEEPDTAMSAPRTWRQRSPNRAVRLAVSGLFLEYPKTGTGRIARQMVDYLSLDDRFVTDIVVNDRGAVEAGLAEIDITTNAVSTGNGELTGTTGGGATLELGRSERVAQRRLVQAPMPPFRAGSYARKLYWEQVALPATAARLSAQVLYSPHFSAPVVCPCPTVISVHDVIPLTDSAYAGSLQAKAYFKLVGLAARRSAAVITLSTFAKLEIQRLLGIDSGLIHVVEPGIGASFNSVPDPDGAARARSRYGLPERYMLYVGGADARKNIGTLLEAIAGLRVGSVPTLVVAAPVPKLGKEALFPDWRAQAVRLQLGDRVQFIERIAEEDLAVVYREALLFVFPSRAEGFGLDPVEAMACGTPVVSSDSTSLPEAVGDAGILVSPDDIAGWAAAMVRLSEQADLRSRLSTAGLERARRFSWQDTGAKVAEIIMGVAACEC